MTRFARAKGSKSSNEKAPEDGTPWDVMKEQLLQAKKESEETKKRQEAEQQRIENYESFLRDRKLQKRPAIWCDFPEVEQKSDHQGLKNRKKKTKEIKTNAGNKNTFTKIEVSSEFSANTVPPKRKKKSIHNIDLTIPNGLEENLSKKKLNVDDMSEQINGESTQNSQPSNKNKIKSQTKDSEVQENANESSSPVKKNRKKKKASQAQAIGDSNVPNDPVCTTEDKSFVKPKKKQKKNKRNTDSSQADSENSKANQKFDSQSNKNITNKVNKKKIKKNKKLVDGQPVRRKEINDRSFQLIIGGKEVELVRFDGFPIMKKDAERLGDLKDSMIKKGIPKSEVQRTMKLERRRAEKALARLRREVCYNCRKGGHNLSDCPDLKSRIPGVGAPEGVCFKCGSTEHRQFECKVQRDKEFRFATCFICKEPGHIARQCPDNPKGLYPNGGSCKLCGDVTHLRKDCPTANNKPEKASVKLQTLDSTDNIEDVGAQNKSAASSDSAKKPKKIRF